MGVASAKQVHKDFLFYLYKAKFTQKEFLREIISLIMKVEEEIVKSSRSGPSDICKMTCVLVA